LAARRHPGNPAWNPIRRPRFPNRRQCQARRRWAWRAAARVAASTAAWCAAGLAGAAAWPAPRPGAGGGGGWALGRPVAGGAGARAGPTAWPAQRLGADEWVAWPLGRLSRAGAATGACQVSWDRPPSHPPELTPQREQVVRGRQAQHRHRLVLSTEIRDQVV